MIVLVCYDIADDRKRDKLAKYLERAGLVRIQLSVFLGPAKLLNRAEFTQSLDGFVEAGAFPRDRIVLFELPMRSVEESWSKGLDKAELEYIAGTLTTFFF